MMGDRFDHRDRDVQDGDGRQVAPVVLDELDVVHDADRVAFQPEDGGEAERISATCYHYLENVR